MARNGSGTYSKINTFVAGTVITASDHNENWDDLVSEMTNSVAADGQTTMTGQLKLSSGTVALPAWTFSGDTDTGGYRIGANNIGIAVNATKILDIATTGLTVTGDLNATTVKQNSFALLPVGAVMDYAGATAPDGWLLCYGQAISRTTYAALFTAIGTVHGVGDGSTTFNLPDCRGRAIFGKDNMGGSAASRLTGAVTIDGTTLGTAGGAQSQTLSIANLPTVTPAGTVSQPTASGASATLTQIDLNYNITTTTSALIYDTSGGGAGLQSSGTATQQATVLNSSTISVVQPTISQPTFTGTPFGSGTAHANLPPAIVLNKIIYAGV